MRTIAKVLNSSVVLVDDSETQQKMIVLGKGIGFGKKAGETISDDAIDEIFLPYDETKTTQLLDFVNDIPMEFFELTRDIVRTTESKLGKQLNSSIYLTLPDHLAFAVERAQNGLNITNKLYWEIKSYYPEEYAVSEQALFLLNAQFGIDLPKEEAANIAFHIINALSDADHQADSVKAAKLIGGIVNLVRYSVTTGIDTNSIHYTRFITHVRFFVDRYFSGDQLHGDDDALYQQMWIMYPEAMENADKIRKYIIKMNGADISNDEVTYLGVHINRLMKSGK